MLSFSKRIKYARFKNSYINIVKKPERYHIGNGIYSYDLILLDYIIIGILGRFSDRLDY